MSSIHTYFNAEYNNFFFIKSTGLETKLVRFWIPSGPRNCIGFTNDVFFFFFIYTRKFYRKKWIGLETPNNYFPVGEMLLVGILKWLFFDFLDNFIRRQKKTTENTRRPATRFQKLFYGLSTRYAHRINFDACSDLPEAVIHNESEGYIWIWEHELANAFVLCYLSGT